MIAGVGGILGYIVGGNLTDAGKEWEAFYTTTALGSIMVVVGCLQDVKLE